MTTPFQKTVWKAGFSPITMMPLFPRPWLLPTMKA
jgi:hypothetical protein